MNFRKLALASLLFIAACDGSNSPENKSVTETKTTDGTFAELNNAKLELTKTTAELRAKQTELSEAEKRLAAIKTETGSLGAQRKTVSDALVADREELKTLGKQIETAKTELDKLKADDSATSEQIALATDKLQALEDKFQAKNLEIAAAEKRLRELDTSIADAEGRLKTLEDESEKLVAAREELKTLGNQIEAAKTELDKLKADDSATSEQIALATDKLQALEDKFQAKNLEIAAAEKRLRELDTSIADAEGRLNKIEAEINARQEAEKLRLAGKIQAAVDILQAAGLTDEAFDLAAPQDHAVDDPNVYDTTKDGTIDLASVDETPATKRHEMVIGGQSIKFTAASGHLIAYAPKDADHPEKPKEAEAAIFYTSYTRDEQPHEKRPITFFFNGGPGSASIWLHMGALGPWRLQTGLPEVPESSEIEAPKDFPLLENRESLLDQSDLVFVDPPGTGHSVAITTYDKSEHPKAVVAHTNRDYWGVTKDAELMQDFVIRYVNLHNRQSSPKYLFGESYGAGIRVPILSKLLLNTAGSRYDPDPSGKPPIFLSGSILLSPVLDMSKNCTQQMVESEKYKCRAWLPTFSLIADYHKKGDMRGNLSVADFIEKAKAYADRELLRAFEAYKAGEWSTFIQPPSSFASDMEKYTGVRDWEGGPYLSVDAFRTNNLLPDYFLNIYDGRMKIKSGSFAKNIPYNFDLYEHTGFHNAFAKFLPVYIGYKNGSYYNQLNTDGDGYQSPNYLWNWDRGKKESRAVTTSVPEMQDALRVDPSWKVTIVHGLYDMVTPFYPTELDLRTVNLTKRIPLTTYEGGHMLYYVEESRIKLKSDLVKFYSAPPYSGPPSAETQSVTLN